MNNPFYVKVYTSLPQSAMDIRVKVFVDEQGFRDEPDEIDTVAAHFVMYDAEKPIATCRLFSREGENSFILGRLAVLKEYRGMGAGSAMLREAEKYAISKGKDSIILHSQKRAEEFYQKSGFVSFGEIEYEENYPHVWMKKELK